MTAIMEDRVPIFVGCIIFLIFFNFSYAVIINADSQGYALDELIYSGEEIKEEFRKIKLESDEWWDSVIAPEIHTWWNDDGTLTQDEAEDAFFEKYGFHYGSPEFIQENEYRQQFEEAGGLFIKTGEVDESVIEDLKSKGMPEIVGWVFAIVNIVVAIITAIVIWSFIYDGLSLIPFVGR